MKTVKLKSIRINKYEYKNYKKNNSNFTFEIFYNTDLL